MNKLSSDQEVYFHITDRNNRIILCRGIVLDQSNEIVRLLVTAVTKTYLGVELKASWALGLRVTKPIQDIYPDLNSWKILSKSNFKPQWISHNETKMKEIINRHRNKS